MINNCKAILKERHCSFRASDCFNNSEDTYSSEYYNSDDYLSDSSSSANDKENCLFGFKKDSMGCVMNACICNTEANGEVHFGDIMVDEKVQRIMAGPQIIPEEGVLHGAADISVKRWTEYTAGSFRVTIKFVILF